MSANSLSRKNIIAITVVVIMAIAVTVLNIRTFGKGRRPRRQVQAQAQDRFTLPEDLAILVHEAGQTDVPSQVTGHDAGHERPLLKRDPFLSNKKRAVPAETGLPDVEEKLPLACTAVVLGNKQNAAMINGKTYAAGDRLGGLTVASVSTEGVKLVDGAGKTVFLAVGDQTGESPALMMEFSPKIKNQKVVMDMTERKQP